MTGLVWSLDVKLGCEAGQKPLSNPAGRNMSALPGVSRGSLLLYLNQWWVGIARAVALRVPYGSLGFMYLCLEVSLGFFWMLSVMIEFGWWV